jgi:hypothetical protein
MTIKKQNETKVPLTNALYMLLYDKFNCHDNRRNMSNDEWVDYIISELIKKNGYDCPFKNYDCVEICNSSTKKGCEESSISITCDIEVEKVWQKFIISCC